MTTMQDLCQITSFPKDGQWPCSTIWDLAGRLLEILEKGKGNGPKLTWHGLCYQYFYRLGTQWYGNGSGQPTMGLLRSWNT